MGKSFTKELKKAQEAWDAGKDSPPGVPEGTYEMQLQDIQLITAKSSGNLMLKREHLVIGGEYEGEVVYDNMVLSTEQNMYYLARFIESMQYEVPEDLSEIDDVLQALREENPTYNATVVKSGDFTNVRIQDVIDAESGDDEEEEGDDGDDDGEDEEDEEGDGEDEDEDGNDEDGDGDEENDLDLLVAFAEAHSVDEDIDEESKLEAVVESLNEYDWAADELLPEEVELLERNEIDVKKAKGKSKSKKETKKETKTTKVKGKGKGKKKK